MSEDVRLQVHELRSQLGVQGKSRRSRGRLRLPALDYSQLHALQDRYEALGGKAAAYRAQLPPIPAKRQPLVLPDVKVEDPVMQNRVGFCRRELAVNQSALRSAQETHEAREPFQPLPGIKVPSKSMPRSNLFNSESRAQFRGLDSIPGLPRSHSVPPPPGAPGSRQRAVAP